MSGDHGIICGDHGIIHTPTLDERLERAARHLCKLRGQDANEFAGFSNGTMAAMSRPRWQNVREEVRAEMQMREAIMLAWGT